MPEVATKSAPRDAFPDGTMSKTVTVRTTEDGDDEDTRRSLRLSNPQKATLGDAVGTATIEDDDPPVAARLLERAGRARRRRVPLPTSTPPRSASSATRCSRAARSTSMNGSASS